MIVMDLKKRSITFQAQLNNNCNCLKHNFVFEAPVPESLVQDFKPLEPAVDIFMSRAYQGFCPFMGPGNVLSREGYSEGFPPCIPNLPQFFPHF